MGSDEDKIIEMKNTLTIKIHYFPGAPHLEQVG